METQTESPDVGGVAAAGYERLDGFSPRGRTVHPYTPASGVNPSITVTHFCVPRALPLDLA